MYKDINVNVSGPVQPSSQYKTVVLKGNLPFASQVSEPNMKYVIKHDFDLNGESVTIPENCVLEFDGGKLNNGTLIGDNTYIKASNIQIFSKVSLSGTFANDDIVVEWFGCSVENSGQDNNAALRYYIVPSAIATKMNVYHSNEGIYKIAGSYGGLSRYIGDGSSYTIDDYDDIFCNGIKIYGTGVNTIIKGIVHKAPRNPGDVFNLVKVHDIIISDLTITAESTEDTSVSGTNAISIVFSGENITIERVNVYDMPYNLLDTYPDGGDGFSIQCTVKGSLDNITVKNCTAKNVCFGVALIKGGFGDNDYVRNISFINNVIENAVCGCHVLADGKRHSDVYKSITVCSNSFIDCQYGIYAERPCDILFTGNYISNTKEYTNTKYYSGKVDGIYLIGPYNILIVGNFINLPYCDNLLNVIPLSTSPSFSIFVPERVIIVGNYLTGNPSTYGIVLGNAYDTYGVSGYFFKDSMVSDNKIATVNGNDVMPWIYERKFVEDNYILNDRGSFNEYTKEFVDKYVPTKYNINIFEYIDKPSYTFNSQNVHAVDNGECQYEGNGTWLFNVANMSKGGYVIRLTYDSFTSGKVQARINNPLGGSFTIANIIDSSKAQYGIAEGTFYLNDTRAVTFYFEGLNSASGIVKKIEILASYHNGMLCGIQDVWLSGLPIHSNGNAVNNVFRNYDKVYSDKTGNLKVRGSELVDRYIDNISNMPTGFGVEDRGLEFFLFTSTIKKPIYNLGGTTWADANGNSALAPRKGSVANAPIGGSSGTINDSNDIGFLYFETDNNRPIFAKSINYGSGVVAWVDAMGVDISLRRSGTYAQRPTSNIPVGFKYWATDKGAAGVGMYIYYTGDNNTPWVDATGTPV